MEYISKEEFEKQPLPLGKYTMLGVSDAMAMTQKAELEITGFSFEEYAQYPSVVFASFKEKGKRKEHRLILKESTLWLNGWGLGFKIDTELNSFAGNACINLVGLKEEIKEKILENLTFKNTIALGIITFCSEEEPLKKSLVFEEEAREIQYNHAPVRSLLAVV